MKSEVIVIGAGGHAKVCIDLLRTQNERVAWCVGGTDSADLCLGVPVLKGDSYLSKLREDGYSRIFIGIGSNPIRYKMAITARELGYHLVNAISPRATISPSVRLGVGIAIMAGAVINADASVEDLAIINTGATVDHDCHIGIASHIAPQCALTGGVKIGRDCLLGVGSKVIPNITIGDRVTIGAGSVVVRNVSSDLTVVGVPAKAIQV